MNTYKRQSSKLTNGINASIGELSYNSFHELSIWCLSFHSCSHLLKPDNWRKQKFRLFWLESQD